MVATIHHLWPGERRVTVMAEDHADHRLKTCFVWTTTPTGQWIASLCARASAKGELGQPVSPERGTPVVLTVKPKDRYYGYEIEAAELLPPEAHP